MALGTAAKSIVQGMFGDVMPSIRRGARGYTDITGDEDLVPSRTVKPEILAGPQGVSNILEMEEFQGVPKQQREESLEIAKQMFEEGESNINIAARTGFGFTPDGKPVVEINDNAAKLKQNLTELDTKKTYELKDILDHKDYFSAYPKLAKAKVSFYKGSPEDKGRVDLETGNISINRNQPAFIYEDTGDIEDQLNVVRTLLHEAQHGVQLLEGFPGGGDPKWFKKGGGKGLSLTEQEAQKRYMKLVGEMWSRNVEARYGKENLENIFQTFGRDPESVEAGITPSMAIDEEGLRTNALSVSPDFEDVMYQDPLERTIR